jgi:predicted aspartyl protease
MVVDIGFDPGFKTEVLAAPVPGIIGIQALVDTGAMQSCIDNILATQVGLPIADRCTISGINGRQKVNMYLAQVRVPSLAITIYGLFAGVHLQAGGQPHRALLGRTFLQNFTMVYEGKTGMVTLSSD